MLPSTTPLAVSTEAFPRSGEGVEERSDETDEGAPLDGANGYSPLIRHFVPPSPKGGRHWQCGKVTGFHQNLSPSGEVARRKP